MKSLTISDIADLAIDRQRACLARRELTQEDRLAELSSSAVAEAKEAADDFISFAFEIESLLAEKSKHENKEAWVLSMRADIELAQQRLRTAISHLTISVERVRASMGSVVEF